MTKMTLEEKRERKAQREKEKKEQHKKDNLLRHLEELRRGHYNEPTYLFEVGDRVSHGALLRSIITEVIDNGKFYKLRELCQGSRGAPDYERDMYSAWVDLRPYSKKTEHETKALSYRSHHYRRISYYNNGIDSLLSRYYGSYAGVDSEPDYQRDLVWELEDKVALIDSIFNQIDIGKFTFIKRPFTENEKGYEILDGKQRLNAIVGFYEDRFTYKGKTYSQLHWLDKLNFKNHPISQGETEPMTDQQKYEYFLRLNTGGKPQDKEHLNYVRGLMK
jgi:hypothetical protein